MCLNLSVNSFLSYTIARLGLLAVTFGLAWLSGLRGIWLYVLSFLGSGVIALLVLDNQRAAMGGSVTNIFKRISEKIDANTRKEDID